MQQIYLYIMGLLFLFISLLIIYLYTDFKKEKQLFFNNLTLLRQELIKENSLKKQYKKTTYKEVNLQTNINEQLTNIKLRIANINFTILELFN